MDPNVLHAHRRIPSLRYDIDCVRRELRVDGVVVPVQRRTFSFLEHLFRNLERSVPLDELRRQVWPDARVGADAVRQVVRQARRALGDHGALTLVTERGYGYKLRAPERALVADGSAHGPTSSIAGWRSALAHLHRQLSRALSGQRCGCAVELEDDSDAFAEYAVETARAAGLTVTRHRGDPSPPAGDHGGARDVVVLDDTWLVSAASAVGPLHAVMEAGSLLVVIVYRGATLDAHPAAPDLLTALVGRDYVEESTLHLTRSSVDGGAVREHRPIVPSRAGARDPAARFGFPSSP